MPRNRNTPRLSAEDHKKIRGTNALRAVRKAEAVAPVRRRPCLAPDRDPKAEEALGDRLREHDGLWSAGPDRRVVVTLWWDA